MPMTDERWTFILFAGIVGLVCVRVVLTSRFSLLFLGLCLVCVCVSAAQGIGHRYSPDDSFGCRQHARRKYRRCERACYPHGHARRSSPVPLHGMAINADMDIWIISVFLVCTGDTLRFLPSESAALDGKNCCRVTS